MTQAALIGIGRRQWNVIGGHTECAGPAQGGMAGIAFQGGVHVRRPLALRLQIVVTARTTAPNFGVIKVHCRFPAQGRMAAIATVRRQNVIGGLGHGTNDRTDAMVEATVMRRAFEDGVHMAGFTGQIAMLTHQFKACGQMIKLGSFSGTGT